MGIIDEIPIWVWIVAVAAGLLLFAMTVGFYTTTLLLVGVVLFIAWRTWEILRKK